MKKKLIKFFIIVNILLTTFNTNILAQNIISGEKLEKFLFENTITYNDVGYQIQISFYNNQTFKFEVFGFGEHRGTWIFENSKKAVYLRLFITPEKEYILGAKVPEGVIEFDDKFIIFKGTDEWKRSDKREYSSFNRIIEQERQAEIKKKAEIQQAEKQAEIKRQAEIKKEQERIKSEQIKKESEERLKKSEEERIKRENEERIRQEKEQIYNNILSLIGIAIVLSFIYYIIKFRKDLSKIFNSVNIKSADKYYLDDKLKNIPTAQGLINKPLKTRKVKNFNINNSKNSKLGIVATFIIFIIFIIFFSHESEPELTWDNRHYGTEKYRIQAVPTWKNCPSHAASGSGTKFLKYINEEIDDCGNKCHPAFEKRIRICLYGEK